MGRLPRIINIYAIHEAGRIEKTFLKWVAEQKRLRNLGLPDAVLYEK